MKLVIQIVLVLIITSIVISGWTYWIVPDFKNNISNFEGNFERIGSDRIVSEIGEKLPEPIRTQDLIRNKVTKVNGDELEISSVLTTYDLLTEEIIFKSDSVFYVNKNTRMHSNTDESFMFPLNVEKRNYEFTHPLIYFPTTFVFEGEDQFDGINTYVFSCESLGEDISDSYPQFNKEILSNSTCKTMIDPITGTEIWFEKTWHDYHISDGQIFSVDKGSSKTSVFTTNLIVDSLLHKKQLFVFYDFIIPTIFVSLSIFTLIIIISYNKFQKRTTSLEQQLETKIGTAAKEKIILLGIFSAHLAHDLRNPLSIIKVSFENLKGLYGTDDAKQKQFDKIERSIDRIVHQVDGVLGFVQEKSMNFEKMKFSSIISESLDSLKIPDNVRLTLPKNDVEIYCDKSKFSTVLNNLILNGIQAITDKGLVAVSLDELDDKIVIEIEDSGKGISKKDLPRIFDLLFTTKQQGTGLGLVIVKSIIESHGGKISVTSPPTIFRIELPKTSD